MLRQPEWQAHGSKCDQYPRLASPVSLFTCLPKHLAFFMQHFKSSVTGFPNLKAKVASGILAQSEIDPDGHWPQMVARPAKHRIDAVPSFINGDAQRSQKGFCDKADAIQQIALSRTVATDQKP